MNNYHSNQLRRMLKDISETLKGIFILTKEEKKNYKFWFPIVIINILCLIVLMNLAFNLNQGMRVYQDFISFSRFHVENNDFSETPEFIYGDYKFELKQSTPITMESYENQHLANGAPPMKEKQLIIVRKKDVEEKESNIRAFFEKRFFDTKLDYHEIHHMMLPTETFPTFNITGEAKGFYENNIILSSRDSYIIYFILTMLEFCYFYYLGKSEGTSILGTMRLMSLFWIGLSFSEGIYNAIPIEKLLLFISLFYILMMQVSYDYISKENRRVKESETH